MESTGVYWRPVYNLLEGSVELFLVNAQHVKTVPGRKTDVRDSEWLAQLLELGLLRRSFVPPAAQRELRDVVRYRKRLIEDRAREANRVQKVLETANIKLASVVTDVLGVSARAMLKALIAGTGTPEELADLAQRRMRRKRAAWGAGRPGRVPAHHGFMLDPRRGHRHLRSPHRAPHHTAGRCACPARLDSRGRAPHGRDHRRRARLRHDALPHAGHAASWAGLCPGNHESAGKRLSGRTRFANRTLRAALVESARGAIRTRNCYLAAQYRRLVKRRGDKKAIVAVAHSILVIAYHVLRDSQSYRELGGDYFDHLNADRLTRYHTKRLAALGYAVTLTKCAA